MRIQGVSGDGGESPYRVVSVAKARAFSSRARAGHEERTRSDLGGERSAPQLGPTWGA